MSATTSPTRDAIIADAKSLPDLIAKAKDADPALAQQLEGKVLLASKSVYGPVVSGGVAWLVAKYGLGWDQATTDLVAGVIVLAASAVFRYISTGPISGIFKKATP